MGGAGGEAQGRGRLTLKAVAHGECSQPSHGTEASAGSVPKLWIRGDPRVGVLSQLPRAFARRQADRDPPGPRASRSPRARCRGLRRVIDRVARAQTDWDRGFRELFAAVGQPRLANGHRADGPDSAGRDAVRGRLALGRRVAIRTADADDAIHANPGNGDNCPDSDNFDNAADIDDAGDVANAADGDNASRGVNVARGSFTNWGRSREPDGPARLGEPPIDLHNRRAAAQRASLGPFRFTTKSALTGNRPRGYSRGARVP